MAPQKKKTLNEINNASRKTMKLRSPASRRPPNGNSPPITPVKRPSKPSTTLPKPPQPAPNPVPAPATAPSEHPAASPELDHMPTSMPHSPVRPAAAPAPPALRQSPRSVRHSPRHSKHLPRRAVQCPEPLNPVVEQPAASPALDTVPTRPHSPAPAPPALRQSPRHSKYLPRRVVQCPEPLNPPPSAPAPVRPSPPVPAPVRPASPALVNSSHSLPSHIEPRLPPPSPPPLSSVNSQAAISQGQAYFNPDEIDIDDEFPIPEDPRSIRYKGLKVSEIEDDTNKRKRGLVTGLKAAGIVRRTGDKKIEISSGTVHLGPDNEDQYNLLIHEIGSCVREKIPMLAPSYAELDDEDNWDIVYNHLSLHFEVTPDVTWLWNYIGNTAADRYKDWKSKCRTHWKKYGKEVPLEFIDRRGQWKWLVSHFNNPAQQELSQRMSYARSKKINHHSGKILFARRAKRHLVKGHKAPHVASYGDAYAGEPAAAKIMDEMENKVLNMLDEGGSSLDEPLSEEIQLAIISEAVGEKKGTRISGVGKAFRKPPRPRGGAKVAVQTSQMREELTRAKEDSMKKDERILILEEKMRELEELVRGGAGSNNVSDGASYGMRRP